KSMLARTPTTIGASDIILALTSSQKFKTVLYLLGYHNQEVKFPDNQDHMEINPQSELNNFYEDYFDWVHPPSESNDWPYPDSNYESWTKSDSVSFLYNLGIASWGAYGQPPIHLFKHLIHVGKKNGTFESEWNSKEPETYNINNPNFWQCIAFTESAAGLCPRTSLCRSLASINILAGQFEACNKNGILNYLYPNDDCYRNPESLTDMWGELMKIFEDLVDVTYFGILNSSTLQRVDSDLFVQTLEKMWTNTDGGLVPEMIQKAWK
ncbi:MAG: hypothetical protein HOI70_08565, partial [Opitutae bacterium]|nr:hypothetical protein [Opitutae bacterium]